MMLTMHGEREMKPRINPQTKHLQHTVEVIPTTVAHNKYVMRCLDCGGAFIKWATKAEYDICNGLKKVKK